MSLYKRDKTWWIRFTTPDGQRIRRSARTTDREQAERFHDELKAEYWKVQIAGDRPAYSWQQAVVRWVNENSHLASIGNIKTHLRWVNTYFGNKNISDITRDDLDTITQEKLKLVSKTTVNRMLETVRAILRCAEIEWDWIESAPNVRTLKVDNRRIRWITKEEADSLLNRLPSHSSDMAGFTLATGLRAANVKGLEWSQIDMQRHVAWVHPDQSKTRKAISVPLNSEAISIIRRQIGKHDTFVFTYRGNPISNHNTKAWRKALVDIGIKDFRWHDLRHTWASWHVQSGTPLHVLQELGGWTSYEMVLRYAHLSAGHLKEYVENVGTKLAQSENKEELNNAESLTNGAPGRT